MPNWNPQHYLEYGDHRTRAAVDLLARIRLDQPQHIADLGCGPGNSTQLLHRRWPYANLIGIDSSESMLTAARANFPGCRWRQDDIATWEPDVAPDLIYSNAAIQWLTNHRDLVRRLFGLVASDGALAFQVPSNPYAQARVILRELSHDPVWNHLMDGPRRALTMEDPTLYYDSLAPISSDIDIWETIYYHVMDSKAAIVDWLSSTGLRPFLEALDDDAFRREFMKRYQARIESAYEIRSDGKVLFPFRRTFVIAYR